MQTPSIQNKTANDARLQDIDPDSDRVIIGEDPWEGILRRSASGAYYVEETRFRFLTPAEAGRHFIGLSSPDCDTGFCLLAAAGMLAPSDGPGDATPEDVAQAAA